MNRILTFLILCVLSFNISAQEIPSSSITIEKGEVDTILLIDSIAFLLEISDSIKDSGDFTKALEVDNQMLILTSQLYGEKHEEYIKLLGEISIDHRMLAEYDKALSLSLECYEMIVNILGKEHTEYPRTLNRLAAVYYLTGNSKKAIELNREALKLDEKIYGKESEEYTNDLGNMAIYYNSIGQLGKALELNLEGVALNEKVFGKNHTEYVTALNNLQMTYHELGNYSKSLDLAEQVLQGRENINGKRHPNYATALNNLAQVWSDLGNDSKAMDLYEQSLDIYRLVYGKEHPRCLMVLSNLAIGYMEAGNYKKAIESHLESLAIYEKIYSKNHPDYILCLNNLAHAYSDSGNYIKAIELSLQGLDLYSDLYDDQHPKYAWVLGNLSNFYFNSGDFINALDYRKKNIYLIENIYGKEHPDYLNSLWLLSDCFSALEDHNNFFITLKNYEALLLSRYKLYEKNFNSNLHLNFYERIHSLNSHSLSTSIFFKSLLPSEDDTDKFNFFMQSLKEKNFPIDLIINNFKYAYNNLSDLKGRGLRITTALISKIHKSSDSELINLFEDWEDANRKISASYEMSLKEREESGFNLEILQNNADKLERKLIKRSAAFSINLREYTLNDVMSNLESNEVFLDILNIPKSQEESNNYYAYVIKESNLTSQLVDLGSVSYFDSIYHNYSNYTKKRPSRNEFSLGNKVDGNRCYENFWSKLEPYLEGVATVYFSPEGVYSKINPNVLYDSTTSSFLMDKYDIVYVSNMKDFVHQKENIQLYERPDDLHAVLVGNPTFLLGENEVVFASNENQSRAINQDELDSLQRGASLSQLPATQTEIDLISRNLKSKGWDVEVISGVDATETRVKSIEAPKILHLATHGFFFEDQEMIKRSNMISTDNKKAVANPMTRSGLVFAGAQNTTNGEILADDNGWLNSYEASLLNLRGTELVVLSACETGSGDVQNGKGVYGLQRAIRVAGAESLIMSMWEVDDKATQELMTYFYDYWIDKNMTKKDAFNKAQQKIREKYKHPYYWGAFIILGE